MRLNRLKSKKLQNQDYQLFLIVVDSLLVVCPIAVPTIISEKSDLFFEQLISRTLFFVEWIHRES